MNINKYLRVILLLVILLLPVLTNIIWGNRYVDVLAMNSGPFFSYILFSLFTLAYLIVIDRLLLYIIYSIGIKNVGNGPSFYQIFVEKWSNYRQKGFKSKDCYSLANIETESEYLDGQRPEAGIQILERLSIIAPSLGFMGTLVGLIKAFAELGSGGDVMTIISALGIAMGTSLLGVSISIICVISAWILQGMYKQHCYIIENLTLNSEIRI